MGYRGRMTDEAVSGVCSRFGSGEMVLVIGLSWQDDRWGRIRGLFKVWVLGDGAGNWVIMAG